MVDDAGRREVVTGSGFGGLVGGTVDGVELSSGRKRFSHFASLTGEKEKRKERTHEVLPVSEPLRVNPRVLPLVMRFLVHEIEVLLRRRRIVEVAELEESRDGTGDGERKVEVERGGRGNAGGGTSLAYEVGLFAVVKLVLMVEKVGKRAGEDTATVDMRVGAIAVDPLARFAALVVSTDEEGSCFGEEGVVVEFEVVEDFVVGRRFAFRRRVEDELGGVKDELDAVLRNLLLDEGKGGFPLFIADLNLLHVALLVFLVVRCGLLDRKEGLNRLEGGESGEEGVRVAGEIVVFFSAERIVTRPEVLKALVLLSSTTFQHLGSRFFRLAGGDGAASGLEDGGADLLPNYRKATRLEKT